jgi:drug/metabolite transporter (DMT)-like permease
MISKYRNRAAVKLAIAVGIGVVAALLVIKGRGPRGNDLYLCGGVLLMLAAMALYAWGTSDLATAKGYTHGTVPALLIVGYFCAPIIMPLMPLIVLFGLKDKTVSRRERREMR